MKYMKTYEDVTMKYTTAEVAQMNTIKVDDPHMITRLYLLGFDYCDFRGDCYFLATPEFLEVLEVLKSN